MLFEHIGARIDLYKNLDSELTIILNSTMQRIQVQGKFETVYLDVYIQVQGKFETMYLDVFIQVLGKFKTVCLDVYLTHIKLIGNSYTVQRNGSTFLEAFKL